MSEESSAYINEIGGDVKGIVGDVIGGVVNQYIIAQKSEAEIRSRTLIKGSPYMGLNKFEPGDKDKFFGREQWIIKLSNHLEANNLLFLLGASGSGKSSLVQAGLIPHLSDQWGAARVVALIFVPDQNPFESLFDSLPRKYKDEAAEIIEEKEPETLVKLVKNLKEDAHKWLIFIDQFEELFTITPKLERDKFIASLVQLIKQQDNSVKLVMAMRSDFIDNLRDYADLTNEVESKFRLVRDLTEIELRLAIAEPAARNGVTFEKGLVEQIVSDFYQQAGSLPLLQYTLDLLWEKDNISAQNRVLNIKTYEDLGGVSGALQQQANKIYEKLNDRDKEAANKIFIELIDLAAREPVSRRAEISQFKNDPVIESVLNRLIENRLLVSGRYKSTVEVAHEQLLRSWKALQNLIHEQEEIIILRSRLINDAIAWHELRKEDEEKAKDELWSGSKLERVLELIDKRTFSSLDEKSEQFIQASVERRDRLEREKKERERRELEDKVALETAEEKNQILAEANRIAKWMIRIGSAVLVIFLGVAAIAGVRANQAVRRQKEAEAGTQLERSGSIALQQFESGKELEALLAAMQKGRELQNWVGNNRPLQDYPAISPLFALQQILDNIRKRNRFNERTVATEIYGVSFSPDGQRLATLRDYGTIELWNLSGKAIANFFVYKTQDLNFTSDGNHLITRAGAMEWLVNWDLSDFSGEKPKSESNLHLPNCVRYDNREMNVFSPNSKHFAFICSRDGVNLVYVWDFSNEPPTPLFETDRQETINSIYFSLNGQRLATVGEETVQLWDLSKSPQLLAELNQNGSFGIVWQNVAKATFCHS